jgi:(p)ppGpp synthase/HD superfamily hydrolase
LKKHPGSYGRIKTVASTIEKLRTGHIEDISDIAATTLVHEKRDDIFVRVKDLKKEHKTKQSEEDNFYEKPLDNVYYAHHMTVLGEKKKALEVQLKTRKMRELQDEMHADYKARKSLEQYKQRAKKLYEEGF